MTKLFIQVHRDFCSFFKANKAFKKTPKKFNGKPQMPRYKHKTKDGTLINADVNGSYNIIRKVFGDANLRLPTNIGFVGNPMKLSFRC